MLMPKPDGTMPRVGVTHRPVESGNVEAVHTTRVDILERARGCVCGDRNHDYGGPEKSFSSIAAMWEIYLSDASGSHVNISPADVAAMMAMLKLVRIAKNPSKMDSWIDLAGYAACGGECASAVEETNR